MVLKEKIEMLIAPAMISVVMISYFFMQIGLLEVGLCLSCLVCFGSALATIVLVFKDLKRVKEYVLTFGALAFIVTVVFFYIFSLGTDLSKTVDAYFWVCSVKLLYFTDNIKEVWERVPGTHPIFAGVWGYLVEKTWIKWDDAALLASKNTMMFACMMPFYAIVKGEEKEKQRLIDSVLISIMLLVIPYVGNSINMNEYSNFGVDMLLGITLGMGVVLFAMGLRQEKELYVWLALLYFVMAIQLKRIAIVLVSLNLIWIFAFFFIRRCYKKCAIYFFALSVAYFISMGARLYLLGIAGALFISYIVAAYYSCNVRLSITLAIAATGIAILAMVAWKWMHSDEYIHNMTRAFFDHMLSNENYFVGGLFKFCTAAFLGICILASLVLCKFVKSVSVAEKYVLTGVLFASVAYMFAMCFLYATNIGPANAKFGFVLAGFDRYLGTIVAMILLPTYYIVMVNYTCIVPILLCISLLMADVLSFSKYVLIRTEKQRYPIISDRMRQSSEITYAYINEDGFGGDMSFEIETLPSKTIYISNINEETRGSISSDDLKERYSEADYVYLGSITEEFSAKYGSLFQNSEEIYANSLYDVLEDGTLYYIAE